jgi:MYXO-CTERM domain-containing protein
MNKRFFLPSAALASLISTAGAAGVSVGASSLIGQLDYSDSFTLGTGTRTTLAPNAYPIGASVPAALAVENNHGNPAMTWTDGLWSISNDASAINGGTVYPGGSGAGSSTGMTQTGGGEMNSGIEYNLRNDFVVQFDAVSVGDRVNLTIGNTRNGLAGTNGLSIFFRYDNHPTLPEVGIYNPNVGEVITSLNTGLAGMDLNEWHNYAARFNGNTGLITLWVDQILLGSIDLITFGGPTVFGGPIAAPGSFMPFIAAATNDAISIGSSGGDRTWMDNFQVGAPIPEPASFTLAGLAGLALLRRRRA